MAGALDAEPEHGAEELLALVAPSAPSFSSEDNQPLRPPSRQLRVACDLAPTRRNKRDPRPGVGPGDGPTSPSEWGDERCVAAQGLAIGRCPVDNEVEAATVVGTDVRRCGAREPLLRHDPSLRTDCLASDLDPRPLHDEPASRQQTRAGAGEVVVPIRIDLAPTTISALRSTAQVREGQGQAKAAPHQVFCPTSPAICPLGNAAPTDMPGSGDTRGSDLCYRSATSVPPRYFPNGWVPCAHCWGWLCAGVLFGALITAARELLTCAAEEEEAELTALAAAAGRTPTAHGIALPPAARGRLAARAQSPHSAAPVTILAHATSQAGRQELMRVVGFGAALQTDRAARSLAMPCTPQLLPGEWSHGHFGASRASATRVGRTAARARPKQTPPPASPTRLFRISASAWVRLTIPARRKHATSPAAANEPCTRWVRCGFSHQHCRPIAPPATPKHFPTPSAPNTVRLAPGR